ncbi:T9SS type A sorting domain-containing protein [Fibrivirga algicola]|uniref:T9SS type A sorting domain-containing protein n=1 Tax=Fibrivirga algicola TaxID=2950420 RepID=A0ABX0QLC7_9BACT|nr:T9SS type A sorting domain-containing protein [Fibrivirga algicola]NID13285.1 T9SS type A sorting domain-containing protein [Fibrivirga algicola]
MRILYFLTGLLLLLPFLAVGQSISVQQIGSGSTVCAGSAVDVFFTTSGTFATGNSFRVQLSNNYGSSYIDLPGSFTSSPATVVLPASSAPGSSYVVRVLADKPLIVSSYSYSFKIAAKPTAQITGSTARNTPVNPYTTVNLTMAITGGSPYTLVLQDSTRLVSYNDYISSSDFPVYPAQTTTYSLARVVNACGTGPVSGSTTVPINAVGFQLIGRGNESACLGSELPVYFSTTAPLPPNTTFEAELISTNDGNRSISVPVSGTTSPLLVSLPKQAIGSYNYGYQLRIYSKSGTLSAFYRDGSTFNLDSSPRLSLSGAPVSMPFGGQTSLILSFTSSASADVFLSDGRQVSIYNSSNFGGSVLTSVAPTATTSYSIVSYSGVCSEGVSYGSRSATIQVRPGLRIDSLSTSQVCAGQPVTLYYTTTPGYTLPAQLRIQYGSTYRADAVVTKPGQLVFTPPTSSTPVQSQSLQLRNAQVDTLISTAQLPLTVRAAAKASFVNSQQTVQNAGQQFIGLYVTSGSTTTIQFQNGERYIVNPGPSSIYYSQYYLPIYVAKTATFTIISAKNECSENLERSSTTVTVLNPAASQTGITLAKVNQTGQSPCLGGREWLNAYPSGNFNADNQFQLEISAANGGFSGSPVQSFTSLEEVSFLLPTQVGSYQVRLSSTSPVTRSNELYYFVSGLPTATSNIYTANSVGSTSQSLTVAAGQFVTVQTNFNGGRSPYQYELANGSKGQSDYGFQAIFQPMTTTSFSLVRVTDACGTSATITSGPAIAEVVPTLLRTGGVNVSQVCVQSPVLVPYSQYGTIPASASYVVQFSDDLITWQTAPTSGSVSPLTVMLPASLTNKQVYYRVAYLLNNTLVSGVRSESKLLIRSAPDVVLTTPSGATAIQIDRNNSYSAEVKLFDLSSDATAILASGTTVTKTSVYSSGTSYYVSQPGTYSVVSAYNSCGYGRATGQIKVTEKPYLALLRTNRTSACVGQTVSFTYAAAGDYEAGNKLSVYLVDNYNSSQARTLLTETSALNGVVSFTVSPILKPSLYSVQLQASAPATTLFGFTLSVDAPVSVSLTAVTRVAYEGDVQELVLGSQATGPYTVTLSTPTGLSVINSSYNYYYALVRLTQTGSYSISSVANQCGVGTSTGVVSVSVLPASSVTIRPTLSVGTYCTGRQYLVYLTTTGVFSNTNTFTAYLTDSTGATIRTLPTVSGVSQLTVTVPTDLPASDRYLLRIGSSSPQHIGSSPTQGLAVRLSPTGTLSGNSSIFKGDSTRISVALTGMPPWQFVISDFFGSRTFSSNTTPYTLTVKPDTTIGFRLMEVRNNQCGLGTATGTVLITVSRLLATEPALPLQVRTWPNPTAGWLQLEGDLSGRGDVLVGLHTVAGTLVQQSVGPVRQGKLQHRLDLSTLPAGVYILTAEQEGRRSQFKVVKQ